MAYEYELQNQVGERYFVKITHPGGAVTELSFDASDTDELGTKIDAWEASMEAEEAVRTSMGDEAYFARGIPEDHPNKGKRWNKNGRVFE